MSEVLSQNKNAFIMRHHKEIFFCKNSDNVIVCMGSSGCLGIVTRILQNVTRILQNGRVLDGLS